MTVNNIAPTIEDIIGETEVNEGAEVTYNAIATDLGDGELTYSWDFGDGSEQLSVISDQLPVSHTYLDNGDYLVTLTVTDEDGASVSQTLDVTVNNVAPTIEDIIGETEVDEGSEVSYSAIASDPGDDELTYSWEFSDGTIAEGQDITHTFADNGNYTITLTVTDDDGGSTNQTLDVIVNNVAPTIEDIIGETVVDEGSEVIYSAIATDPGDDELTYSWELSDGTIAEGKDISHTFTDNGNYTMTLIITDDDGASTSQTLDITVNNVAPTITDIIGETIVDEGAEVSYSAIATDPGDDELTYSWEFSDGTIAEGKDISHTFADNGNYSITLTVTDDDDASVSQTLDVVVNNVAPTIEDIIGETVVDEGAEVSYSAIASDLGNDELSYSWDFGDGTIAEGKDVTYTFADNGNYTITLTVTDDDGASTSQTLDVIVNNVTPLIDPWLDQTVDEGELVIFNASFSDPGILDSHTIQWDFGDGSEVISETIDSSELGTYTLTQTHTYKDDGVYTATLTIIDKDGATTNNTMIVTVNNVAPVITYINEVDEGEEVPYRAIAFDPGDDELTYVWDFGDGSTAEGANVLHTFTDDGIYTVNLTVTDDDGASTTSTSLAIVNNIAPTIEDIIGETEVNEGAEVSYSAIASDPGDDTLTYSWEFSDGTIAEGKDITHTFADNGNYAITLTVTDDDGGSTTETLDITVNNVAPTITEIIGETEVDEGAEVSYSAIATDPGDDELTYSWEFSDGTIAEGKDITHTFADNGNYKVTLTVTDDDGASISQTLDVTVNNVAPTITEIIGETVVDEGAEVSYSAIAFDPGDDELTYSWDFGDGTIVEGKDVTHIFADNGNYAVTLTVTDDDGAFTSQTLDVIVNNVAPTITDIIGETVVDEGSEVSYSAIASDPGDDELTYAWEFSDGTIAEGKDITHTFANDGNDTVTLTVTDDDGAATTQTLEVQVKDNKPPIIGIVNTNLVQNWSFEDNEVQPNRWDVFENISGWETIEGPGIEVQELNDDFGLGADGTAWVELDSHDNSRMRQDISTKLETSYQLSFAYSPRPNLESTNSNGIEVYWNGDLLDLIRAKGSEKNNWKTYTYTVAASDLDLTALEFLAVGKSDSTGGFIDSISVQEIINLPESVTVQILEQQNNVIDLVAFDPEGETEGNGLTYRIIGGADATSFNLDPETGIVTFIESPIFAEPNDLDSDNIYDLEVEVSDSQGLTDTVKLAIAVKPIDQPPLVQIIGENKVQNWSFEDNEVQPNRWGVFNSITGWITTRGAGIEVQELNNLFGSGGDGNAWVELDSHNNSTIRQDISTKPETSYQLSFAYSPRPRISSNSNVIGVYWNGELLERIRAKGSEKNNWTTYTYTVAASDLDLTALQFRALGKSDSLGGFIDSVSVREIIA